MNQKQFMEEKHLILINQNYFASVSYSPHKNCSLEQSLIPVAFKRKLLHTGSYTEEFIVKEKVKTRLISIVS